MIRKWQDKEGNDKYSTEIIADKLQLLGGKQDRDEKPEPRNKDSGKDLDSDSIPF